MSVTILALIKINEDEPAALAQYLAITMPLLDRVGAEVLKRFSIASAHIGEPPSMAIFIEYPNRAAIRTVFNSPEYREIIDVRDRAFLQYDTSIVAQKDDTAIAKSDTK